MIQQNVIDTILARTDIVKIISRYVPLTKAGANYKACCPFHNEDTPSFIVSPARQTWHCFGGCQEGGNVISFLMKHEGMTFPEAVKRLAAECGVEVEEQEEDAAHKEQRLRREALLALNSRVADFYRSLLSDGKTPATAWQYACRRWGDAYVRETGIGFAPDSFSTLYDWAIARGENIDHLIELGLLKESEKNGRIYDAYRNRLMIPIRDRYGNVTGFTARDLSDREDTAKYINSCESEVYHKSRSVFGIDNAWREGARKEVFYLVEGAPDAMKMQSAGINNAVAPLGSAWTEQQFLILKKIAPSVCFINDADPVPAGKIYGNGIGFVLKNGELAIRLGLKVTVRELPCKEGNLKQDPGDYFTSAAMLDHLKEEDFVVWAARKYIRKEDTSEKKTEAVRKVAELTSYINDDMRIEMLLSGLNSVLKGKALWQKAIQEARRARRKEEESSRNKYDIDLRKYGFYEENGMYYSNNGDQWSNFTLKPVIHVVDRDTPVRIFSLKNIAGDEVVLILGMEELNSVTRFRQKLEGFGNYMWLGSEKDMMKLKFYLYDNTETARKVEQLGWNSPGFYAFGNGIWTDGSFQKADEFGICRFPAIGNFYIPAAAKFYKDDHQHFERQRKFAHIGVSNIAFSDYMKKFCDVFGNNGKVGLLYWAASLYRDIITASTRSFPLLDLFGPKGSGKTELGAAMMAFFVVDNKAPNLKNSTSIALNDDVASVCNALVHFDEYKNDIRPDKIEFLKGLYDGVGRTKMGGANYDDRKMTSVKTGVVISGQEIPTADIALFHRCVFLSFPKSEFSREERVRFAELQAIQRRGLTYLTLEVLRHRQRVENRFSEYFNAVMDEIAVATNYSRLETRIVENWSKLLAVFKCLEDRQQWPFTYSEMFRVCLDGLLSQNRMSGEGNEISKFWDIVLYLRDNGEIFDESDLVVDTVTKVKTNITERIFPEPHKVLWLNTSRVFMLYKEHARRSGDNALPEDALREYLKNCEYFLGIGQKKFKSIIKGVTEMTTGVYGTIPVTKNRKAMVFDYEKLQALTEIDFETKNFEIP